MCCIQSCAPSHPQCVACVLWLTRIQKRALIYEGVLYFFDTRDLAEKFKLLAARDQDSVFLASQVSEGTFKTCYFCVYVCFVCVSPPPPHPQHLFPCSPEDEDDVLTGESLSFHRVRRCVRSCLCSRCRHDCIGALSFDAARCMGRPRVGVAVQSGRFCRTLLRCVHLARVRVSE